MPRIPEFDEALCRADWRRVNALYRQFSAILNDRSADDRPSDDLVGALAEWIGRTFAHYEGEEQVFMDHLFSILRQAESWNGSDFDQFHWLYRDSRLDYPPYTKESTRRRPGPFEAAVETTRRLIDLNAVRERIIGLPTSSILGGSLSYGRFFNTRGGLDKSDTDLLVVIPDYSLLPHLAQSLSDVCGLARESAALMLQRISHFEDQRRAYGRIIFGHHLRMWEDRHDPYLEEYKLSCFYRINIHVFSHDDFKYLILQDVPVLKPDEGGRFIRDLHEYREDEGASEETQRAFNGSIVAVPIERRPTVGGYVVKMRICHIERDRFFPGTHLNLILPQFEVRWESPTLLIRLALLGLRWKLLERLSEERRLRTFEHQLLSASHTRAATFSPHVRRRVDSE